MNIDRYVAALRESLEVSGEAAGPEIAEAAGRLAASLEPSVRLVTLQVLTDAADELTSLLGAAPSVEVRLRGVDPELVVVPGPDEPRDHVADASGLGDGSPPWGSAPPAPPTPPGPPGVEDADAGQTRVSLRMPGPLKAQAEAAAAAAGVSLNTWLVRAAQNALGAPTTPERSAAPSRAGKRLTGWAH